jgi:hypothetical protein
VVGLGMVGEADGVAEVAMPITTTILGTPVLAKAVELRRQLLLPLVDEFGIGDGSHDTNVSHHERRMQMQMPKLRLTAKTKSEVKTDRARTLHGVKCYLLCFVEEEVLRVPLLLHGNSLARPVL